MLNLVRLSRMVCRMVHRSFDFYSVDASSMIRFKDMLPRDLMSQAWDEVTRLADADRWKIFRIVSDEVGGTEFQDWIASMRSARIEWSLEYNAYINQLTREMEQNDHTLIDPSSLKNSGDPFVIALALMLEQRDLSDLTKRTNESSCCVITQEKPHPTKINIPYVCRHYGLTCINLFDFMRNHGWCFTLSVKYP